MVETVKRLCKARSTTITSVEKLAGLSKSSIAKWDTNSPSIDKVLRVCSVLEVPLSAVVDDPYAKEKPATENGSGLMSAEERRLVSAWRRATDKERATISVLLADYGMSLDQDTSEKLSV